MSEVALNLYFMRRRQTLFKLYKLLIIFYKKNGTLNLNVSNVLCYNVLNTSFDTLFFISLHIYKWQYQSF